MPSPVVVATSQAAVLAGLSNIVAQAISAYQSNNSFVLDIVPLTQFILWALISTPPNYYFQEYLEETFPSTTVNEKGQEKLSRGNTVKKILVDQAVASPLNALAFLAGLDAMKGRDVAQIQKTVQQDFWPLIQSGWKLWPLVSVLCFTVVPPSQRVLVVNIAGVFWGIYLSLLAA